MIVRSIPSTLKIYCQSGEYADGLRDGIVYALQNLQNECDIIMRKMPEIEKENELYYVRARFTAKSKEQGQIQGRWIVTNAGYFEEEEIKND